MNNSKKVNGKSSIRVYSRSDRAITLIALIVTIIVHLVPYDKNKKYSNLVGFSL